MSLREWLITIGTLVIIGIVIDGLRRMRRAKKESMAISSGMGADDLQESPLDQHYNPELPNGGARTVSRETLEERGYVRKAGRSRFANPEPKPTRPVVTEQGPVADSTEAEPVPSPEWQNEPQAPEEPFIGAGEVQVPVSHDSESGWGALDDDGEPENGIVGEARTVRPEQTQARKQLPEDQHALAELEPGQTTEVEQDTASRTRSGQVNDQPLAGANRPEALEVIVINVLAKPDCEFQGMALKQLFEACGLAHGDLDIYHRHEQSDTYSPVQFSVANAVEPGTFRPADMATLSTPGISFFMSMPGPSNALQAFEFMLETAQCVVRNLGGELKDERRSVMTAQTIEHCRQRIREYERKSRSRRS
ncbi:cell division protein ZipA [Marinobacter sp. SS21]|uniref:cell division protein ZipA n=1 Tax=Marinobacter sp. SS21 TaxID=2979460 RepID=UPI00232AD557|nr:cell division protein ZipA [Marinobacter sp. SS21]MDC0663342.1 cell division protein ZipA [Marinobacter sp. SS21]